MKCVNVKREVLRIREYGWQDTLEWEANKMPHENSGSITVHTISNLGLKWEVEKIKKCAYLQVLCGTKIDFTVKKTWFSPLINVV